MVAIMAPTARMRVAIWISQSRQIAIEHGEQRSVEERHERADQDQLMMRPREQIGQGEAPAGKRHRHVRRPGVRAWSFSFCSWVCDRLVRGHEADREKRIGAK